jgi:hypothetical protein
MDPCISEQDLRREAIRRHLADEARGVICDDLERSTSWFDKWWARYQADPHTDFVDQSRAPHTSPHQTPAAVVHLVTNIRKTLEAGRDEATRYGLIGADTIQERLIQLQVRPLPSTRTIERILCEHDLTHPVGAGAARAYYPWPVAWAVNAIQATDIVTRYVYGGEAIENFHTIDRIFSISRG